MSLLALFSHWLLTSGLGLLQLTDVQWEPVINRTPTTPSAVQASPYLSTASLKDYPARPTLITLSNLHDGSNGLHNIAVTFSNNFAQHSPIDIHIHTPVAMQGDSSSGAVRARCLAKGHLATQLGGAGDRSPTFLVPANPLYLLSHITPR